MPKGIFSKILLSTLLVIAIFSLVAGTSLTIMMQRYTFASEEKSLMKSAEEIRDLTVFLLENGSDETKDLFQRSLNTYANQLDSAIFVTDRFGRIMLASQGNQTPALGTLLSLPKEVVEGKTVRHWGTMDGLFLEKRLNLIFPLVLGGQVGGALFLSSPMPRIDFLMLNVLRILLISVIISLAVSFLIAFYISQRISRPVRTMKKAAEEFAKGNFDARIPAYEDDEMGELAVAFNHMAKSLEELEQNRRSFVANVSHELRSPLTTIGGFAEGLLDGTVSPENRERYLRIVLAEVKRMTRLVNDLLYMERNSKEELHQTVFDINELIRLVLIGMESRITEKQIDVSVEFCKEAEWVKADQDGISRVVTNLLDNAVKFTHEKGDIGICVKEEGNRAKIQIANSGEVIPKEMQAHIFDRFYKGDQSRGVNKDGTGLGLHIVKVILAKHGQGISVISNETEGTVFTFSLPLQNSKN